VLFNKRLSIEEFAEALRLMHGTGFSLHALDKALKGANVVLTERGYGAALQEFAIFGFFVVSRTDTTQLGRLWGNLTRSCLLRGS